MGKLFVNQIIDIIVTRLISIKNNIEFSNLLNF